MNFDNACVLIGFHKESDGSFLLATDEKRKCILIIGRSGESFSVTLIKKMRRSILWTGNESQAIQYAEKFAPRKAS